MIGIRLGFSRDGLGQRSSEMVGGGDEGGQGEACKSIQHMDLKTVLLSKLRTSELTSSLRCHRQTQPGWPPWAVEILVEAEDFLFRIEMGVEEVAEVINVDIVRKAEIIAWIQNPSFGNCLGPKQNKKGRGRSPPPPFSSLGQV